MAKAKTKAESTGRGHGGGGVTAAPLPPTFISGRKVRDGVFIVIYKRGDDGEPISEKIDMSTIEGRIEGAGDNAGELQWLVAQCDGLKRGRK
jgi:hypothetical protein